MLHPSALALVAGSLLTAGLLVYAARWAITILSRWDLASGSSLQLELERRTVLLSALVRLVLLFQLASVFLYVYTADSLAPLFTGAMCAAGTLKASGFGYPVLLLKLLNFLLAGLWLAVDHLDARAPDFPLVRPKYAFLLALTPAFAVEAALQAAYFADLRPEVITSCCGSLFGRGGRGLAASLSGLPPVPTAAAAAAVLGVAVVGALVVRATGRGAWAVGAASALAVPVSLAAVIAVISPYVYALPTHHCPFCLLQREYHFVGYALYATILGGGLAGMATAVAGWARARPSLASAARTYERHLAIAAATAFLVLAALSGLAVAASELRM
jgi:hypothetical protein